MSLTRQMLNEFAPMFNQLARPLPSRINSRRSRDPFAWFFEDFPQMGVMERSAVAVDLADEGHSFKVEAELPGVKKEDIDIRVGEAGKSLTIEGKVGDWASSSSAETAPSASEATVTEGEGSGQQEQPQQEASNEISSERQFRRGAMFSRTLWFPRPVDADRIQAKFADGVLTVLAPKLEDKSTTRITIE